MSDVILRSKFDDDYYISLCLVDTDDKEFGISTESFGSIDNEITLYSYALSTCDFAKNFDSILQDIIPYECIIDDQMNTYHNSEFIYPTYSEEELFEYFERIKFVVENKNCPIMYVYNIRARYNDIILKHFHHSIYDISIKGKPSMSSAWRNTGNILNSLMNRLMYKSVLNQKVVQDGLNIAKIASKPSILTIKHSLLIFEELLKDDVTIIDPIMGFSGKLIASILLNKKYTGIYDFGLDNNYDLRLSECQNLIKWITDKFPIFSNNVLNIRIDTYSECSKNNKEYDSLICEIPYWNNENNEEQYTDDMIDKLISEFNCKKYIFIIKDSKKYKDKYIDKVDVKTHLYLSHRHIVLIQK